MEGVDQVAVLQMDSRETTPSNVAEVAALRQEGFSPWTNTHLAIVSFNQLARVEIEAYFLRDGPFPNASRSFWCPICANMPPPYMKDWDRRKV